MKTIHEMIEDREGRLLELFTARQDNGSVYMIDLYTAIPNALILTKDFCSQGAR